MNAIAFSVAVAEMLTPLSGDAPVVPTVRLGDVPFVVYEIRESMLDKLLGRQTYILPSDGYALSNDKERLVVPDTTAETAASNITTLIDQALTVRTFSPSPSSADNYDDTWVRPTVDDDETIIRVRDEEETVLRPPRTVD